MAKVDEAGGRGIPGVDPRFGVGQGSAGAHEAVERGRAAPGRTPARASPSHAPARLRSVCMTRWSRSNLAIDLSAAHGASRRSFRVDAGAARGPGPASPASGAGPAAPATIAPMEIMGIRIPTIVKDNVARRCDGCLEVIEGTPWRVNLLDIVATEVAGAVDRTPRRSTRVRSSSTATRPTSGAGWPSAASCSAAAAEVREIMRPIRDPGPTGRRSAGACATGSTATTTSSSPPDGRA